MKRKWFFRKAGTVELATAASACCSRVWFRHSVVDGAQSPWVSANLGDGISRSWLNSRGGLSCQF